MHTEKSTMHRDKKYHTSKYVEIFSINQLQSDKFFHQLCLIK